MLEKKPFVNYSLDKPKTDIISLKINKQEREMLDSAKQIIEQTKDGTTLKTLAWLGYESITKPETKRLISVLFKNKRNNERLSIPDFD